MNKRDLLALPLAAGAGLAAGLYGLYSFAFASPRGRQNDDHAIAVPMSPEDRERSLAMIDALNARPYERVFLRSYDGLRLAGRYYATDPGAPLAILCHGYRGTPSRDFCGGAELCLSLGMNVLLIEERAHVTSQGRTITFGVRERYDVLAWARYAAERFGEDTPILLGGISMGAATVLMASGLDLPGNVRGILADCPYTSPPEILREFAAARGWPVALAYPMAVLSARVFGGFSLSGADAREAVARARIPILLIHGEADGLVPCEMSREIARANPEMTVLHTFPGADHGLSYLADKERYTRIVTEFCEKIFDTPREEN